MKIPLTSSKKFPFGVYLIALSLIGILVWVYFFAGGNQSFFIMLAALLGIYMAMNIGANDIANNMGPAVGAKALTLGTAILIAAVFEAGGAIIAGGDVVNTIKGGIITPGENDLQDSTRFIAVMLATLAGASLWINIATFFKAPVSATHSVIGGLLGAGISAYGVGVIQWSTIGNIALSWIISPLLGGLIAAGVLYSITSTIIQKKDRIGAAQIWVPVYTGLMFGIFSLYLILKGLKPMLQSSELLGGLLNLEVAVGISIIIALLTFILTQLQLRRQKALLKNSKSFIYRLFQLPLICAVALLSFAHGSNDVANAIGPLAAIVDRIQNTDISGSTVVGIPFWIMVLGAIGIVAGLSLFGKRMIKTVGKEITKLNQIRAYSVALATACTVLGASQLGLPVSSTHIAIGGVFGVGFLRSFLKKLKGKQKSYVEKDMIKSILLSWVITLPVSALIASGIFFTVLFLSSF